MSPENTGTEIRVSASTLKIENLRQEPSGILGGAGDVEENDT